MQCKVSLRWQVHKRVAGGSQRRGAKRALSRYQYINPVCFSNALVDTVRHEIIERYRPGKDAPHLKVLQAAHISNDAYFSHMVLDGLNLIIRDIRESHKKDSESAPQTTVADELKENLEAVEKFQGQSERKAGCPLLQAAWYQL